jgi:hypothetical protein
MKTWSHETVAASEEARAVEVAKTARLRALRLAKEAADQDAEQIAAAVRARFKAGLARSRSRLLRPRRSNEAG